MENSVNSETIYIPSVIENSDNGNYIVIAPKSEDIKQGATGLPHHILFPKSQLLQFVESKAQQNNTQHANQLNNAFRSCRDDIKRANHNEVEKRRRDKISSWISQLGQLLPVPSKNESIGETLTKVCEYIPELQNHNRQLIQKYSELNTIKDSIQLLEKEINAGIEENGYLKDELLKCGFQLEQVTVPEPTQPESTYLEFENSSSNQKSDNNQENTTNDSTMHNDIDTYFET